MYKNTNFIKLPYRTKYRNIDNRIKFIKYEKYAPKQINLNITYSIHNKIINFNLMDKQKPLKFNLYKKTHELVGIHVFIQLDIYEVIQSCIDRF
jgi:hypothetical protein